MNREVANAPVYSVGIDCTQTPEGTLLLTPMSTEPTISGTHDAASGRTVVYGNRLKKLRIIFSEAR